MTIHNSAEKSSETNEISELYNGKNIVLKPFKQLAAKINYHHSFDKESWQQSGRIRLKLNG